MKMVRSIVVTCALVAAPLPAFAQRLTGGVLGGINIASFGGDDVGDSGSRTGLAVGLFLTIPAGRVLAFQPELLYSEKGATTDVDGGEASVKLSYVEVPLLLRLNVPLQGASTVRPFVLLGPSVAFKTGCKVSAESGSFDASVDCDDSAFQGALDLKSVDFGASGGAGLGFAIGRAELSFEGRYTLGLTSLDDSGADADVKNRAFTFLAGLSYPLGR